MNERIKEIGEKVGFYVENTLPGGFPNENLIVLEKFTELILQDIYNQVKEELVDDSLIDAESDIEDRCYLRGSNGGIVDALCIIQNYGKGIEL